MPLTYAEIGKTYAIKKINGNSDVKKHLENMGFVMGSSISIINTLSGNVIVSVKGTRVAINKDIAKRIIV